AAGTIPASGSDGVYTVKAEVTDLAGNPASDTQGVTLDETAPSIVIGTIAGDNIVSSAEAAPDRMITASSSGVQDGQPVHLTLLDSCNIVVPPATSTLSPYTTLYRSAAGTIPASGSDGVYTVKAEVTDLAGNPASDTQGVTLDETAPSIVIGTIAGDNIVSSAEAAADVIISGSTSGGNDGPTLHLTPPDAGNNAVATAPTTVTGNAWSDTVAAGTIPPSLPDAVPTVKAEVTDLAGNPASDTQGVTLDETAPSIVIGTIAGDNIVSSAEAAADVIISGSTSGVEDGQTVHLTLLDAGNRSEDPRVGKETGNAWSSAHAAAKIPTSRSDGAYTVQAAVTDLAGNPASDTQGVTLDETAPSIVIGTIAGDNIVSSAEAAADVIISGSTSGVEDGQTVHLTLLDAGN